MGLYNSKHQKSLWTQTIISSFQTDYGRYVVGILTSHDHFASGIASDVS